MFIAAYDIVFTVFCFVFFCFFCILKNGFDFLLKLLFDFPFPTKFDLFFLAVIVFLLFRFFDMFPLRRFSLVSSRVITAHHHLLYHISLSLLCVCLCDCVSVCVVYAKQLTLDHSIARRTI